MKKLKKISLVFVGIIFFVLGIHNLVFAEMVDCDYDGNGETGDCIPSGENWRNTIPLPPSGCDCCGIEQQDLGVENYHTGKYNGGYYNDKCIIHGTANSEKLACENYAQDDLNKFPNSEGGYGWCGATGRCSNHEGGDYTYYPYTYYRQGATGIYTFGCGDGYQCVAGICEKCFEEETSCYDGIDNDCNGLVDCEDHYDGNCPLCPTLPGPSQPWLSFNTSDGSIATIGNNGVMSILGNFYPDYHYLSLETSGLGDFVIQNKTTENNVLVMDAYYGDLTMWGFIYSYVPQSTLNEFETNDLSELIIKNSEGNIITVFDGNGNIYLSQYLKQ